MSDTRTAIDAGNQSFMTNFGQQDAAGMASLYTADGSVFPANSDILSGAESVQAFWQGAFDMGLKEAVLETLELEVHGETAIETGHYTLKADGGAVADRGVNTSSSGRMTAVRGSCTRTSGTRANLPRRHVTECRRPPRPLRRHHPARRGRHGCEAYRARDTKLDRDVALNPS